MKKLFTSFFLIYQLFAVAQDDLLSQIEGEVDEGIIYTSGTFKGTRLINGHSVESRDKNTLVFIISHRFGSIGGGAYEFFGLDGANIRLGLDYAVTNKLYVGLGRSSLDKIVDGFVKYKILRQSSGDRVMPISMSYFGSAAYQTLRAIPDRSFSESLSFTHQLLIARKLTTNLSLQVVPTWVHYNLVLSTSKHHDVKALGVGGRYKTGKRVSINAEYYYQLQQSDVNTYDAFAVGIDLETGGHVFQIQLTNANAMIEKGFIGETYDNFFNGDIHIGFNITRNFQLKGH